MAQGSILAAARAADGAPSGAVAERLAKLAERAPKAEAAPGGAPDLTAALAAFVAQHARGAVDEGRVRELVAEAIEAARITPRDVRVHVAEREPVTVEGPVHPAFDAACKRLACALPVLLVGPAGTGKTHLARQLAQALGLDWHGAVSFTAGTSEGALLGRLLPTGEGGRMEYAGTPFVRAFEEGGLVCLDEVDAADPNTLGCLNAALANGELWIPARVDKPRAVRHERFAVVACANTWGNGGSREYVGRNQLDAATLDRFRMGRVLVDYDRSFEARLVGEGDLLARWWELRSKARELALRVVVSTRGLLDAHRLMGAGLTLAEVVEILAMDWTPDMRTRLGVGGAS